MARPAQQRPARILVVDDHALARAGLRAMLAPESDFALVGEAADGAAALRLCRELRPDLVLLDLRMPVLDGLATTRAIKAAFPAIAVLVVTIFDHPDYLCRALEAGAVGYLLKDATQYQLTTAVRQALHGGGLPNPALLARLRRPGGVATAPPARLTMREAGVLRLLAAGRSNPEIAADLGVGIGTVRGHVGRILGKLGAANRAQAAVLAVQMGLVLHDFAD
jgi:DNA-binding NarL/FixJ family response regulator